MGVLHVFYDYLRELFLFQKQSPAVTDLLISINLFSESTEVLFTSRSFVSPRQFERVAIRIESCRATAAHRSPVHGFVSNLTVRVLEGTRFARTSRNWSSLT